MFAVIGRSIKRTNCLEVVHDPVGNRKNILGLVLSKQEIVMYENTVFWRSNKTTLYITKQ
jgi:hypothetical protein